MKSRTKSLRVTARATGSSLPDRAAFVRSNPRRASSAILRALTVIPVFALFSLHCSAKAEVAQPPLIDGKPAFLMPDFAIDRTLPNLGSEPTAKAPGKAKADDATHSATQRLPKLAWRAVATPDDIFLERAPGELQ